MSIEAIFTTNRIDKYTQNLSDIFDKDADSNKIFLLDSLPEIATDNSKFSQYEKYLANNKSEKTNDFVNFFINLWVSGQVKLAIGGDLSALEIAYKPTLDELLSAVKSSVDSNLNIYFIDGAMQIICWLGDGLSCPIYCHHLDKLSKIEKIANVNGFYIR